MDNCKLKYEKFSDQMSFARKQTKVINNFLADMGGSMNHSVQLSDLDKAMKDR